MTPLQKKIHAGGLLLLLSAAALAAAPPTAQMEAAEVAVRRAEAAAAANFAPVDLRNAQDKLEAARAAVAKKDYRHALPLAEEALVDAELAAVTARRNQTRAEVERRSAENARLREELAASERPQ